MLLLCSFVNRVTVTRGKGRSPRLEVKSRSFPSILIAWFVLIFNVPQSRKSYHNLGSNVDRYGHPWEIPKKAVFSTSLDITGCSYKFSVVVPSVTSHNEIGR